MIVALTGATGFVGGAVLRRLLRREHQVRVLVRNPDRAGHLRDYGAVEQVHGDLGDEAALRALVAGADAVVHLVGIIAPKGPQSFERVHVAGTAALAAAARAAGVRRFAHMSALGARADAAATPYHRTKAAGEEAVRRAVPGHVILRPSLIAGPGSIPLRMMINMVRLAPVVPVIGDGRYRMQPVWLEDVAEAFALAIERTETSGTFDIAGPEQLTWHAMLDRIEEALGVRRRRVRVPLGIVRLGAAAGLALPDLSPITPDQLQMLIEGSTTEANALATVFGVTPRPFALVVREMCAPYASDQTDRGQEDGPGVAPRA
jgi:NADH dehydrogenase